MAAIKACLDHNFDWAKSCVCYHIYRICLAQFPGMVSNLSANEDLEAMLIRAETSFEPGWSPPPLPGAPLSEIFLACRIFCDL